jgi:hypothetical protein
MDGGNDRRVPIKFCFKAGLSATETLVLVQKGYGNEAVNRSNVFYVVFLISRWKGAGRMWRERWPSKIESNWGKHCCCCWFGQKWPSNRIKNDSRIFEHPQDCSFSDSGRGFGKESCVHVLFHTPLHLSKGKIKSHFAKTLSRCRKKKKKKFNRITMGDEIWCFAYDLETKRQSSEWVGETSPRPNKLKFQRSRIKTMLIIFFDSQGIVHKEFISEGETVNAEFYRVMDRLLKSIQRVRPAAFCNRDFFLLHDNAPAHTAASVCQFLTPKNVTTLYPPHVLSRFISAILFSVAQVENEVTRIPLCRYC